MKATIAGRTVQQGDHLYNTALQLWGEVLQSEDSGASFVVEFRGIGNGNTRTYTATDGGFINGKRVLYWHKPIELDLPFADISALQRLVDLVLVDGKEYNR